MKVWHLASDKKIAKAEKMFKDLLAGKLQKKKNAEKFFSEREKFRQYYSEQSPRYPNTYMTDQYINMTIPKITPKTPMEERTPHSQVGIMMHKNVILDPNDVKVQKIFGIHAQVKKSRKPFYPLLDISVIEASSLWVHTVNNNKIFKDYLNSGKKMIVYFGDKDCTSHVGVWADYIWHAYGKDAYHEFMDMPWERKSKPNYVTKLWKNIRVAIAENAGHIISWDKPETSYNIVKSALEEDN